MFAFMQALFLYWVTLTVMNGPEPSFFYGHGAGSGWAHLIVGRQGPNSLEGRRAENIIDDYNAALDARVEVAPAVTSEAAPAAPTSKLRQAKPSGEAKQEPARIKNAKRAYRRAVQRAQRSVDNTTRYRGRRLHLQQLGGPHLTVRRETNASPRRTAAPADSGPRLRILTTNLGGTCNATYDILMNWLEEKKNEYDIIQLQEVHYGLGKDFVEYQTDSWIVVSSPDPKHRWAGVATLISRRLVLQQEVRHNVLIQGRLLHVRTVWEKVGRLLRLYKSSATHPDAEEFAQAYTYQEPGATVKRSQIDYIIVSPTAADGQATPDAAQTLTRQIHDCCVEVFPQRAVGTALRPWQQPEVKLAVKDLWERYHELREPNRQFYQMSVTDPDADLKQFAFDALRKVAAFQKCQRILKTRGKERRQALVHATLREAEDAAEAGDMHALYQSIRKLAPKARKEKIQIRDKNDQILSPQAEYQAIHDNFEALYSQGPPNKTVTYYLQQAYAVTDAEILRSLQRQSSGKAVPQGKVPPEVWCLAPGPIALPTDWRDGSTYNAISRVARHCQSARQLLGSTRREVHDRRAGTRCVTAAGAAALSIDMSKAFDQVSHAYLAQALAHHGVDQDTIHLILALHQAEYHISHQQHQGSIAIRNGIRQGCVLSPLLWVCVTSFMLHRLGLATSAGWVREAVTAFADDFICTHDLRSLQDAADMQHRVQQLFRILAEAGMQVNTEKSQFLIKVTGGALKRWVQKRKHHIRDVAHVNLGTPFAPLPLACVDQIEYLGVVVSYGAYEEQTLAKRLDAARANLARLSKYLFGKRGLSLRHRISMYRVCVRSATLYGLPAVGVTEKGLQTLHKFEIKHLRAIAKSPRHLSHETNAALMARLGYTPVAEALGALMQNRLAAMHAAQVPFPGLEPEIAWQQELHTRLVEARHLTQLTSLLPCSQDGVACPECGLYFPNRRIMRGHVKRKHGYSLVPEQFADKKARYEIDITQHCVDGMPVCRHCRRTFRKWRGFQDHILRGCQSMTLPLTAVSQGAETQPSPPLAPALQFAAGSQPGPNAADEQQDPPHTPAANERSSILRPFISEPQLMQQLVTDWVKTAEEQGAVLSSHCAFCTQWCSKEKGGIKNHIRRMHPDLWKHKEDVNRRLKKHYTGLGTKALARLALSSPSVPPRTHPSALRISKRVCCTQSLRMRSPSMTGKTEQPKTTEAEEEIGDMFSHHLNPRTRAREEAEPAEDSRKWHKPSNKGGKGQPWGRELCLRHEDTEAAVRVDSSFMLYLDTRGSLSITRQLFDISADWKVKKEAGQCNQSLRTTLIISMLSHMRRLMETALEDDNRPTMEKHGWVTRANPPGWAYMVYNPETEAQEVDAKRPPLPHADIKASIHRIFELITVENVLHKFHATRPMAEKYQSEVLPMILMISNRGPLADELRSCLVKLCDNACMRLIGARMRQDRLKRQPLAVKLSEVAANLLDQTNPGKAKSSGDNKGGNEKEADQELK
ncbi:unnamed protein product [Symbiodinium sp. CCMP2456]|nr:unnamed protein product [Symbiodinium sp. CCMP2456]